MYKKAFIINNDGKIFIFPKNIDLNENELEQLESKLRQFTTSINYSDEIHEFNFDIYSIWSLIVMGEEMLDDFISFLESDSVNEFPKILKDKIKIQKENFKQVLLQENLENIIINVLNGDLELIIKKYLDKEVKSTSNPKVYTSTKDNYNTITRKLLKHNVSIKLDNYLEDVESINLDFRCTFTLRYYEAEALNIGNLLYTSEIPKIWLNNSNIITAENLIYVPHTNSPFEILKLMMEYTLTNPGNFLMIFNMD